MIPQTRIDICPECQKPRLEGHVHINCRTTYPRDGGLAIRTEQFDWESEDHTMRLTFDITRMLVDIRHQRLPFDKAAAVLDRAWVREWLLPSREPNIAYARSLSVARLAEPVLGVWMPGNSVLLVDGTHRYLGRYLRNAQDVYWHIVAEDHWRPYAAETKL